MTGSKISIIVPVYKVELFLEECIDSILEQTYRNLEIILINDGSPDNCGKICDEYAIKDERIKVIHKKNGGLSDARNAGIENCLGEYIAFIDSDDILHPEFIEILYQNLVVNKALISCCNFQNFKHTSDINYLLSENKVETFTGDEFLEILYEPHWIPQNVIICNKIYRKSIFEKLRFPLGKLHEDEFVFHEIYNGQKKIVYSSVELYFYRKHDSSITKNYTLKNYYDTKEAYLVRIHYGKKNNLDNFVKKTELNLLKICIQNYYKSNFDKKVKKDIMKQPTLLLRLYFEKHFNLKEITYLVLQLSKN